MKKIYLMVFTLLLTTLVACSPDDKVTIEFWHNYSAGDGQVQVLNTLIEEFEAANPNIKVEAVFQEWSALRDGVVLGAGTGVLPDVLRGDIAFVPQFHSLDVLVKMSDFEDYSEVAKTILAQPNSTALINGSYYGIAANTNTKILFYNEDLLAAKNVEVPTNLEALYEAALAVSTTDVVGMVEPWTGIWNFGPMIWSEGGDILAPDNSTASGYLNSDIVVDVITKMKQLYDAKALTGSSMNPSVLGDTDGWAAGKYAFQLDGPWRGTSNDAAGINYGAIPLPAGKEGSISVLGGEDFMILDKKDTEKREAAWKFVKFMISEEAQVKMAKKGQMPVNISALDNQEVLEVMPLLPVFKEALQTAKSRPVISQWSEIENIIAAAFSEAIIGAKPVKQALDAAVVQIDALLK
ncbi:extracellular solute-binding protein [Acholeplasma laidlawii]|uniref:extracellular solute-binding protein n=1 Tax=Acholeplasma laidlawii TaxID=2148 RepID=UPI0018C266B0|nr:extracellular solute-binding protein [Acholeplasma laidlawii]MBG0762693.1 extracellular solute-binding protein [Acholeplasma laidlawii]